MNSAAGGGSFLSFPALVLAGFPPIAANATNNAAMWLGTLGSISGFREDLDVDRRVLAGPVAVGVAGGLAGGILLLRTPEAAFAHAIPWLLAFATAVFALSPLLRRGTAGRSGNAAVTLATLFGVAVYGGYFGAGIGILMLALFASTTALSMRHMNALKNLLGFAINGIAVVPFALARAIAWPEALLMAVGAVAGAYVGARVMRRLPDVVTRGIVVTIGTTMSIVFFLRG